jgi:hypothetical protein
VLLALAQRFDTDAVKIDRAVFNASRICKVPGTVARKGDNTKDRPHRRARLLEVPGCDTLDDLSGANVLPVPAELLEALAAEAKEEKKTSPSAGKPSPRPNGHAPTSRLLVDRWLTDRAQPFRVKEGVAGGRTGYLLKRCPFDPSHGDPDSCVMQDADGKMSANCFHASCAGRGWKDFKAKIGLPTAEHYEGGSNGAGKRERRQQDGGGEEEQTGYRIILDYFRALYRPLFKRGTTVYSDALGREVKHTEACFAPGIELAEKLAGASDAPTNKKGDEVELSAVPFFFRTWAPSAWKDMLAGVVDEERAAEVSAGASDEFRGRVSNGLFAQATYGVEVERDGVKEREQQRRTLLQWCSLWAKPVAWGQVRGALLWCRKDGEGRLWVAVRVELFGQFGPRELAGLTQRKFADLCELYGVGEAQRACHNRVVVLSQEFLASLLAGPAAGDGREMLPSPQENLP